jgi:S-adenosylmethionine:tRNA ribosyltransferase-isomerase
MRLSDFNYSLPEELIAQEPLRERDKSRLLVVNRDRGTIEHHGFTELLDFLADDDLMVFNDTRVVAARLVGRKEMGSDGQARQAGRGRGQASI